MFQSLTAKFLLFFAFTSTCFAQEFRVPPLTSPVMDNAQMMRPGDRASLEGLLRRVRDRGGSQITVLTIETLNDLTIEQAAIKIFDQWKLGSATTDNGILFIVAKKERKMRIEVGKGREGDLPDAIAKRIIVEVVTPAFKSGDFSSGIVDGVRAILERTDPNIRIESSQQRTQDRADEDGGPINFLPLLIKIIILIFFFGPIVGSIFFPRLRRRGFYYSSWGGGGFGGGSSGGGGGGWSGGGGGSNGGGASGGW